MSFAFYLAAWLVVAALAVPPGKPRVDPREVKRRESSTPAEIRRKQAELKRRSAEMERKAADLKRKLPPVNSPPSPPGFNEHRQKARQELDDYAASKKTAEQATANFNPAAAPSPEDCWRAFVSAARSATSMEPLLRYLPLEKQDSLRRGQASFDPRQAAESRASWRRKDPKMTEETLEHLTSSPYAHELKWHKDIAAKYIAIIGVEIAGNKATLRVSTKNGGTVDGVEYPYGTAKIELLGQGNFWRLDWYGDDNTVYLNVPQTP